MSTGKTYSTKYLLDSNNNRGSEGQILSTTSTGIDWVDANSVPGTGLWVTSGNSIYNSNSGNVGIGTTSPAKQLVVRSSAPWIRIEEDSASNKRLDLWVDPTSAIGYIGANQSAQQLSFQTGSSDRIRILNNGNVGIGTTAPGAKLVISGGGGAISDNGFQINSSYGFNGTGVLEINPSATSHIPLSILSKNGQTANLVNVTSFGGTAGNLFNVQSSGNVGIGTDSPTARLDILTNSATGNGDIDKHIRFRADNGEQRFNFKVGQSGNAANLGMYDGDEVQKVKIDTNGDSYFNGGNVGIGTTSPVEKLHVDGKAFINGQIYGGFGALTTSGTLDWNDSTNARSGNGHTLLRGNATNGPAGGEYYHPFSWEYAGYDNDGNMTQFAIPYSTNNTGMYYRSRYSGTWNDWAEIVTTTKTLPGGPYLPLSAGASYPLTGDLYLKTASNQGNLFFGTADANYKIFGGGTYGYMGYNTGGYHRFLTSGVEKMRITSAGNVGIGTTSPGAKLEISHSGSNDGLLLENTNNVNNYQIALNIRENEGLIYQRWTGGTFNANLMRIGYTGAITFDAYNSTNNTGTPTYLLGTDASGNVVKTNTVPGSGAGPYLPLTGGTLTGNTNLTGSTKKLILQSGAQLGFEDAAPTGTIYLYNDGAATSRLNIGGTMWVEEAGNVGIGTTSPTAAKLVVSSDTAPQLLIKSPSTGSSAAQILLEHNGGLTQNASITFDQGAQNTLTIATGYQSSTDLNRINIAPAGDVGLTVRGGTGSSSGNVGIGTTSPSVKLDVNGEVLIASGEFLSWGTSGTTAIEGSTVSNKITFRTQSTERMRIDSSGNVGIGVTSPVAKLNIVGSGENGGILFNNSGAQEHRFYSSANSQFNTIGSSAPIWHWAQHTGVGETPNYKMTLNNTGLGIGTTSPSKKLHVVESGTNNTAIFENSGQTYSYTAIKVAEALNNKAVLSFAVGDALASTDIQAEIAGVVVNDGGVLKGDLTFKTNVGDNVQERMRINSSGNVGIGTTNPLGKLQVNEYTVASQGNQGVHGEVSVFANDGDESLFLGLKDSAYPNRGWAINPVAYGVNSSLQIKEHGSTAVRMTIQSGGNVGIGTTSPSAKLEVEGSYGDVIKAVSGSQNITTNFVAPSTGSGINNIISTAGKFNIGTSDAQPFSLLTNSISRIAILSDGKVGIGTTSPSQKLEVAGSVAVTGTNVTVANASNPYIYINDTDAGAGIFQQEGNTTRIGSDSNTQVVLVQNNATAVTIDTSKNVGIGTTSPDYKLEVNGTLGVNRTDGIIFAGSAAPGYGNKITVDTSNDFIFSTSLPSAPYTTSEKMRIANNGAATFTSTVTATNFILSSDERLKENVEKVCDNRVKADWKTFELKTDKGQKRYGVVAQELEKTNPEFVREDSQGFKSVAYIDLLIAKIAELEARLEKLEK